MAGMLGQIVEIRDLSATAICIVWKHYIEEAAVTLRFEFMHVSNAWTDDQ